MKKTLLIGFFGWCDAGHNVVYAIKHITSRHNVKEIGNWNIEEFWHAGIKRPEVMIKYGIIRRISWPKIKFFRLEDEGNLKGIAFGEEPNYKWQEFSAQLVKKVQEYGFERIILLGSLYDRILHDETIISSVVSHPDLINIVRSAGCQLVEYEGPSAVHSPIILEAALCNLEALSLWMHIPFYFKNHHEKVIARLFDVINIITDANLSTEELLEKWDVKCKELEKLLRDDKNLKSIFENLKQEEWRPSRALPSPSSTVSTESARKIIDFEEFIKRKKDNEKPQDE